MMRAALLGLCLILPAPVLACACCADPGHRSHSNQVFDDTAGLMAALGRAERAHLYMTACGPDCVTGVEQPEDHYEITASANGRRLTLELRGAETSGSLDLLLPTTMNLTKIDLTPEPRLTTSLHTEFYFSVGVVGTGAFQTDVPVLGTLVLSGQGNHCMLLDQASHWTLNVEGEDSKFRLFGPLKDTD